MKVKNIVVWQDDDKYYLQVFDDNNKALEAPQLITALSTNSLIKAIAAYEKETDINWFIGVPENRCRWDGAMLPARATTESIRKLAKQQLQPTLRESIYWNRHIVDEERHYYAFCAMTVSPYRLKWSRLPGEIYFLPETVIYLDTAAEDGIGLLTGLNRAYWVVVQAGRILSVLPYSDEREIRERQRRLPESLLLGLSPQSWQISELSPSAPDLDNSGNLAITKIISLTRKGKLALALYIFGIALTIGLSWYAHYLETTIAEIQINEPVVKDEEVTPRPVAGAVLTYAVKELPNDISINAWRSEQGNIYLTGKASSLSSLIGYCRSVEKSKLATGMRLNLCEPISKAVRFELIITTT